MNFADKHLRIQRRLMHTNRYPALKLIYLLGSASLRLHPVGTWTYFRLKTSRSSGDLLPLGIRLRGGKTVHLRDADTDLAIFEQIFLLGDCSVPWASESIRYVIDAGAHIGCSSLYFAARHPDARILAVEADERNYRQLLRNTVAVPNIRPIHAAVFHLNTQVVIANPDDRPWGFQVGTATATSEIGQKTIPGLTIPELMTIAGFPHIDLLKIDIEGAERDLFDHGGETWLRSVRLLVVEFHNEIKPGCSESFHRATASIPHDTVQRIDNLVWRNRNPKL